MAAKPYAERYEGVFGLMKFDETKYEEYPKWVTTTQGRKLVANRAQELEQLAYAPAKPPTIAETKELGDALQQSNDRVSELEAERNKLQEQLSVLMQTQAQAQAAVQPVPPVPPTTAVTAKPVSELRLNVSKPAPTT